MGENSKIEWCDHTFNPWIGCQKVSPGCDHCYAEALMDRRYGKVQWGPHGERKRTSDANWRLPLRWAKQAHKLRGIHQPWTRPRVFCASLADWLDNQAPQQWRVDLANLIAATPELDWLLLTKRIENFHRLSPWGSSIPFPSNVWLGITTENQEHFERRWDILHTIPATVRFISYEPALGPLSIRDWFVLPEWIIAGGESGPHARPSHPEWFRQLRNECTDFGISFFFKQHGEWAPIEVDWNPNGDYPTRLVAPDGKHIADSDVGQCDFPNASRFVYRLGKKRAGRLLDGREHNEFPKIEAALEAA